MTRHSTHTPRPPLSRSTPEGRKKEDVVADRLVNQLQIKTPSLQQVIAYLSGGNQQKVVVGKWLAVESKILLLDEPTRGIDVGAKLEIYNLIDQLAKQGMAVILVSSELPEVCGMADRILVMRAGRIVGELSGMQPKKKSWKNQCSSRSWQHDEI